VRLKISIFGVCSAVGGGNLPAVFFGQPRRRGRNRRSLVLNADAMLLVVAKGGAGLEPLRQHARRGMRHKRRFTGAVGGRRQKSAR
jgi:hypothetical protein